MTESPWQGEGPEYTIPIGGRTWRLDVSRPQPGLACSRERSLACLLTLLHLSTGDRRDDRAFDGSSLTTFERHRRRIQAVFSPRSWPGLSVRAAWEPTAAGDGVDLEVQVHATSTLLFPGLEIGIESRWIETGGPTPPELAFRVESRQAGAPDPFPPRVCRVPGSAPVRDYLEMVPPDDCVRRVLGQSAAATAAAGAFSIQHALFGHDLEKGVVLRGRIRGIWVDPHTSGDEVRRRYEAFLREPPDLGP